MAQLTSTHRGRRGHALLFVLMIGTLFPAMWMVVDRTARTALTVEASVETRDSYEERIVRAIAYAGHLLEKAVTNQRITRFVYSGQDAFGVFHTTVEMHRSGRRNNYSYAISARPATPAEINSLPINPARL